MPVPVWFGRRLNDNGDCPGEVGPKANIIPRGFGHSMTTLIPENIQMNHTLFALVLLSAAPFLYAQNTTNTGQNKQYDDKPISTTGSGKARADVKSGVTPETTYRNRQIESYKQDSTKSSSKSRAEVKAEVAREGSMGTKQTEVATKKAGPVKGRAPSSSTVPATTQ